MTTPIQHTEVTPDTASIVKASDTLYRAFHKDPAMDYYFPPPSTPNPAYDDARFRFFSLIIRMIHHDVGPSWTITTKNFETVALWLPPGTTDVINISNIIRFKFIGLIRQFGISSLFRLLSSQDQINEGKREIGLKSRYYYLLMVGTAPEYQGKGYLKHVMNPILEKADAENLQTWLEATKLSSVPIYEKYGFKQVKTLYFGKDAVPLVLMMREPHGAELRKPIRVLKNGNTHNKFKILVFVLIFSSLIYYFYF